ncbi:hypothetical protein [Ponticaulis sp.]|uniref:alpha/beta hydrolase family esterase n=1 Tax=Ponticaulis sp. TaxID=2020902 RepID=UPI00263003F3|nr:hypothetical protein [Ponticaulis sp.]MDF1679353.1 hypothetical protein [Ponticaulis sp.]
MKTFRTVVAGLIIVFSNVSGHAFAESFTLEFDVDGTSRNAIIQMPEGAGDGPYPLIMIFHGGGGSAHRMQRVSEDFARSLNYGGYVVAFMNGTARRNTRNLRTWNADHCCAYAADEHIDDAAYVNAVYAALTARTPIIEDEIYLFGHSNGAMLSYRIASDLSFTPDALVIVSGAMFEDQPTLPRGTSILAIHTRDDETLSFSGDGDRSARHRTAPILAFDDVRDRLEAMQSCGDRETNTQLNATLITGAACENGGRVVTLVSDEGGHAWPKDLPGVHLDGFILGFLRGERGSVPQ